MSSAKKFTHYMVVAGGNAKGEGGDAVDQSTKRDAVATARKLQREGAGGITVWKMYDDDSYTRVAWRTTPKHGKRRRAYSSRGLTARDLAKDLRIAEANLMAARAASDLSGGSPLAAANARDAHEALYDVQQAIKAKQT